MDGYLSHGKNQVEMGPRSRKLFDMALPSNTGQHFGNGSTDEDRGIIETSSSERRIWLVKMPDFVFDRIADLDGEGDVDVGVVRICPAVGDSPVRVMIKLDDEGPCKDIPLEYELRVSKAQQNIHMFTEDESNRAVSIDGRVEQECQMKPILSSDYRQMLHTRTQEANRPTRSVQYVDAFESPVGLGLPRYVNENVLLERWNRRAAPELRRERLPHQELLNLLFHQFERQNHWTLQQLVDTTRQPVQYLKEVLSEIAIYNTRGPYKNLYELKSEFKGGNKNV